jgi:DNA-binding winged helix-turn-helix (wHTH) protein
MRSRIGPRWWRRIHYLSFAAFLLTLAHGVLAGSDTSTIWAQLLYVISGGSLLGLTIYRVAWARRASAAKSARLQAGGLTLDPQTRIVTCADARQIELRAIEMRLLRYLMLNASQAVTTEQILAEVWGPQYAGQGQLVRRYIRRLRVSIELDPLQPIFILSAPGQSYQLAPHSAPASRSPS